MMQAQLAGGKTYGKWRDIWYMHPLPTMNEPNKAICSLTPLTSLTDERKADLFLRSWPGSYRQYFPDHPSPVQCV